MKYRQLSVLVKTMQEVLGSQETKTQKKLVKIFDKIKPFYEELQAKVEELRLDNASTDENDILTVDDKGNYKFTKEGMKSLRKQVEELDEQEFNFTKIPVVNPGGLEKLTFLKDWLSGVTFEEEFEEEL